VYLHNYGQLGITKITGIN